MTAAHQSPASERKSSARFVEPETAVAERIDQLILAHPHQQNLLQCRKSQAAWLKQTMGLHWDCNLPQPFVGFDLEEGLFIAEWQSDMECNTLTIDADSHQGWYNPWPAAKTDAALSEQIDLDTEEGWEYLRDALTTTRP